MGELGGFLDWKFGGFRTLEDSFDVTGQHGDTNRYNLGHTRSMHPLLLLLAKQHRPKAMVHRGISEPIAMPVRERAGLNDERQRAILLHRSNDIVHFVDVGNPS